MLRKEFIVFAIIPILLYGFNSDENDDKNIRLGLLASFITIILSSYNINTERKGTYFSVRFGNLFNNIMKAYCAFVIFLYFQKPSQARKFISFLENKAIVDQVNEELHTYEVNCEFSLIGLWEEMDHYFLCHLLGWFFLMFAVRDVWFTILLATSDEFMELSFKYILPHLGECWYDSWFLDLIVSNCGGILIGYLLMKYLFKFEFFDYFGRKNRSFTQWKIWNDPHRLNICFCILIFKIMFMINTFFGMNALWVSPKSIISLIRLGLWVLLVMPFMAIQTYFSIVNKEKKIETEYNNCTSLVLIVMVMFTELGIVIKHSKGAGNFHTNPVFNYYTLFLWIPLFSFWGVRSIYLTYFKKNDEKIKNN